ncbi:hypothetical protein HW555_005249 [Spodoptera exigua]|uniref:Uncharacterized protein n=1 Tax=Spodoptera exigua TaxID=7107 RepID=A0A835GIS9_SPOEX|nr:hypothetical protein HW555_005249 [Spodoptera exigua]
MQYSGFNRPQDGVIANFGKDLFTDQLCYYEDYEASHAFIIAPSSFTPFITSSTSCNVLSFVSGTTKYNTINETPIDKP